MTKSAFQDFKPLEAVARSLVPATFPQFPWNSTWWRCSIVIWGHSFRIFGKPRNPRETVRTAKSLGPATIPQLPRSSTWFLSCVGSYSCIAKHAVFNDKHFFHQRTPLCCFVVFPPRKLMVPPRNYPATTVSQILSWLCPLAIYLPHATTIELF